VIRLIERSQLHVNPRAFSQKDMVARDFGSATFRLAAHASVMIDLSSVVTPEGAPSPRGTRLCLGEEFRRVEARA